MFFDELFLQVQVFEVYVNLSIYDPLERLNCVLSHFWNKLLLDLLLVFMILIRKLKITEYMLLIPMYIFFLENSLKANLK